MARFTLLLSLTLSFSILSTLGGYIRKPEIKIPTLPPPLTPPTLKLAFVALGVGTQNYTCGSTGTFTNVGALAEIFDISGFANTAIFDLIPDLAIAAWKAAPPSISIAEVISTLHMDRTPEILGQHYFVPSPINGQGLNPKWDFTSQGALAGNPNAFVVAAKVDQADAPTGSQDIAWLSLKNITGELAQQIYRIDTRLGQPPANCNPGSPEIEVKYVSQYCKVPFPLVQYRNAKIFQQGFMVKPSSDNLTDM
ncbi:hypothetical protein BYT27DRAFT_7156279 [Phlegmacium glaucopus]|nr:hypothetical protein BYT27DRAFT_7156279 [Phlegmacium glaucopus]